MKELVLLILSVISFVLHNVSSNSIRYSDINTESICNDALTDDIINYRENGQCHAWDGSQCRKGKFNSNKDCEYEGSYFPLFFLILGISLLVYGIYSFFYKRRINITINDLNVTPSSSSKMSRRSRRNKIL